MHVIPGGTSDIIEGDGHMKKTKTESGYVADEIRRLTGAEVYTT
jgi:hypothetical protein